MRKFLAEATVVAVALFGFAGAAHSSATIDLIWDDTDTNVVYTGWAGSLLQLKVILTAGPAGSTGAGVSVDYSSVEGVPVLFLTSNTPDSPLPLTIDNPPHLNGSRVELINSICLCNFGIGTGLAAGQSHQLGTVTFSVGALGSGRYEITSDVEGPIQAPENEKTDGVLDGNTNVIPKADITFNSAFLVVTERTIRRFEGPKRRR